MTTRDLIISSLRLIGAVASGETPDASEMSDGLAVFNDMIDSWNTEHLAIYSLNLDTFPLVSGKQAYTVGDGKDFNIPRPVNIERIVLHTNATGQPLEWPLDCLTDGQWAEVRLKTLGATYPRAYWDDGGFPFRTISFWPIPQDGLSVVLYRWNALTKSPSLNSAVSFPPGYQQALRYNLAILLAPEFGVSVSPEVAAIAISSKAKLKIINTSTEPMRCDPALASSGDASVLSLANFYAGGF